MSKRSPTLPDDPLRRRAQALGLYGLLARWEEFSGEKAVEKLIETEEGERKRRSLERRIRNAKLGRFKPLADFDWAWPKRIDRDLIEELFTLAFLGEGSHAVIVGPNGVGKSTIAKNLAHQALLKGHTVRFTTASEMLNELAAQDGPSALTRRLRRYTNPSFLCCDEVGYLSYDSRHADLLFEVVSRRYEQDKSMLVTTNRPFAEWNKVFPNASSVVALVDRLVHRAQVVPIEAESYRLKEAQEREAARAKTRSAAKKRRA
jgi:DNA replication protein DnaC